MKTIIQKEKELLKLKKEADRIEVNQAICAAMHILYDSRLYGSNLWPKYFTIEWFPEKNDHFTIAARIDNEGKLKRLIINANNHQRFKTRMYNQLTEINLILDNAVYAGVLFTATSDRAGILGRGINHLLGHSEYTFKSQQQ